jgi:hypothetical protein
MQFAFRWMNCLLMRELSVQNTIRMWDTYLVRWQLTTTYPYLSYHLPVRRTRRVLTVSPVCMYRVSDALERQITRDGFSGKSHAGTLLTTANTIVCRASSCSCNRSLRKTGPNRRLQECSGRRLYTPRSGTMPSHILPDRTRKSIISYSHICNWIWKQSQCIGESEAVLHACSRDKSDEEHECRLGILGFNELNFAIKCVLELESLLCCLHSNAIRRR